MEIFFSILSSTPNEPLDLGTLTKMALERGIRIYKKQKGIQNLLGWLVFKCKIFISEQNLGPDVILLYLSLS